MSPALGAADGPQSRDVGGGDSESPCQTQSSGPGRLSPAGSSTSPATGPNKGSPSLTPPPPPSTGPNMRGWSPAELPRGRDESGPIWLPTLGPEPGPHRCRHLGAKTPSGHRMSCQGERRPGKTASRQDSGYGPSSRSPTQNGGGSVTSKPVWETNVGDAINHRAAHPKLRPKTAYTPRNP